MKKTKKLSASQLAAIEALNREILKFGKKINNPYASAASAILTLPILYILFMYEDSPFYHIYAKQLKKESDPCYKAIKTEHIDKIESDLEEIDNLLAPLGNDKGYIQEFGENHHINDIASNVEALIMKYPHYISAVNKLKKRLFLFYREVYFAFASEFPQEANLQLAEEMHKADLSLAVSQNFNDLWSKTHITQNRYMTLLRGFLQSNFFYNIFYTDDLTFYKKISIAITLQGFVTAFINKYFQYGIFQPLPPKIASEAMYYSATGINKHITDLQKYHDNLAAKVCHNTIISRYLLVPAFLAFVFFYQQAQQNPQFILIAICLLNIALTGIRKELVDLYTERNLNKNISQAQENISKALKGFPCKIELERFSSLVSTYFIINFYGFAPSSGQEELTGKRMASIFSKCLYINQIELLSQRGNTVVIYADQLMNYKKLRSLRNLFDQAVEREAFIHTLKNQLNSLMIAFKEKYLNLSVTFEPGYDSANLPWLKIELSLDGLQQISEDQANKLGSLLMGLFAELGCKIDKSAESFQVSLEGFKSLDKKALEQVIDEISHISVKIDRSGFNEANLAQSSSSRKLKKPKMEGQKNKAEIPIRDLSARVIEWPSGKYDSQDRNSKVHPVPFGGCESTRNYEKARIFFTHNIDPEKIPVRDASLKVKIFTKLENLLKVPKVVPKKEQGFIFWQGMVNDLNGKPFQASIKGKLKGADGSVRFFAEAEKSATGETLYVIKGVEPRAF